MPVDERPSQDPIQPGEILGGKYRVIRQIGAGGMGRVFLARHDLLEQDVAVKVLLGEFARDAERVERFMREAKACAKLQSEHAIRVMDVGLFESGAPYIVMEYLHGQDLDQILETRGPITSTEATDLVLEALDAIAEAHAHGIVHRDLKPSNLFLAQRADGSTIVKVLDFGISKQLASAESKKLTGEHLAIGTPAYMSPEQLKNSSDVDGRADLWSMGVVLFELMTGGLPFDGGTPTQFLANILTEEPATLASRRGDTHPDLDAVVRRCLLRKADARYTTAAELADALAPFGSGRASAEIARIKAFSTRAHHVTGPSSVAAAPESVPAIFDGEGGGAGGARKKQISTQLTWKTPAAPPKSRFAAVAGGVAVALGLAGALAFVLVPRGATTSAAAVGLADLPRVASAPAVRNTSDWVALPPPAVAPPPPAASTTEGALPAPRPGASVPAAPVGEAAHAVVSGQKVTPPTPASSPPVRATPAPPARNDACDPPFTLDEQGRKHFKAECFGVAR